MADGTAWHVVICYVKCYDDLSVHFYLFINHWRDAVSKSLPLIIYHHVLLLYIRTVVGSSYSATEVCT